MRELFYLLPLAIALLAILWRLLRPRSFSAKKVSGYLASFKAGNVIPMHYQFFPQIQQALSEADDKYLGEVASPDVARRAREERRKVARHYLRGLREDFSNLEQLGRMIAAMSPVVNRRQELERLGLSLRFRFVYALVWARFSTGALPLGQIQYLTGLIGRLATRMEQAISEINALTAERLSNGVSA
jgi:hypothetical protein